MNEPKKKTRKKQVKRGRPPKDEFDRTYRQKVYIPVVLDDAIRLARANWSEVIEEICELTNHVTKAKQNLIFLDITNPHLDPKAIEIFKPCFEHVATGGLKPDSDSFQFFCEGLNWIFRVCGSYLKTPQIKKIKKTQRTIHVQFPAIRNQSFFMPANIISNYNAILLRNRLIRYKRIVDTELSWKEFLAWADHKQTYFEGNQPIWFKEGIRISTDFSLELLGFENFKYFGIFTDRACWDHFKVRSSRKLPSTENKTKDFILQTAIDALSNYGNPEFD